LTLVSQLLGCHKQLRNVLFGEDRFCFHSSLRAVQQKAASGCLRAKNTLQGLAPSVPPPWDKTALALYTDYLAQAHIKIKRSQAAPAPTTSGASRFIALKRRGWTYSPEN
jgi:hypothetical protein